MLPCNLQQRKQINYGFCGIRWKFVDAELMKNKTAGSMIKAYLALWKQLTASEMAKLTTHMLDNKASEEFKAEIRKKMYNQTCTSR
jgi:hypothetical protein